MSIASCYGCKKQFVPNNATKKCTNEDYYFCLACVRRSNICSSCSRSIYRTAIFRITSPNANEREWAKRTGEEIDLLSLWQDSKSTNSRMLNLLKDYDENHTRQEKSHQLQAEIKYIQVEAMPKMAKENQALKGEMERMRKEMEKIKNLLVNFENPKENPQCEALMEEVVKQKEENAGLKAKFDEFEEYEQMIKNIKLDQARIKEINREIEEKSEEVCSNLEVGIEELHNKIENFVIEMKSDLGDKKNRLIKEMKVDIQKLQEEQKALLDQSRNLQQQNIKRSKMLQNKLELANHKFDDTVQMKDSLLSYFDTESQVGLLPSKDPESLDKKGKFGSNLSLSTTASSFERISESQIDQQ